MSERRVLWYAAVFTVLAVLWICGACAFPEKWVTGTLVDVQHDDRYEAPCGIRGAAAHACDEVPVCCSYRAQVADTTGKRTEFWAFWPRYAPGLLGLVAIGDVATFHLHVHHLLILQSCSEVCPSKMEYTLDNDADVTK